MIGLDTNLVVRFLVQDDAAQAALASEVFGSLSADRPGFIGSVVLAEISWVLTRAYKAGREEIAAAIEGLLRSEEIIIENTEAAYRALAVFRDGRAVEFADALIAETARLAGASETLTFDRRAASESAMRLVVAAEN
ncbi:MAG: type II toxin-antitoxin system VapC family toxin [Pseudomonadota bacterium]